MNNIKLSKRLIKIANIVSGDVICDVGCDHGKLSYYLLKNNICKFAYVSDISKPSLDKADKLLSSENMAFKSIHCDGLQGFTGINIDECIIAGMGGDEIIKIISNSPIEINSFILSPQHNILEVKEFILSNNFEIVYDRIIKDGHKFYSIFKCVKGKSTKYPVENMYFGKDYNLDELNDLKEYLISEKNKVNNLLTKVNDGKKEQLTKYLNVIEKLQKDWRL